MFFTYCDFENIIIISVLVLLFCFSLKERKDSIPSKGFLVIGKDYSLVIKGIACILVLMGHYINLSSSIVAHGYLSKFVYATTANIGLVWFMFFSGYGLSLKKVDLSPSVVKDLVSRILKVFFPLLFVCFVTTILYGLLPNKFSPEEIQLYRINTQIQGIHEWNVLVIVKPLFGWLDWYVYCIMIFYSIYYASSILSSKLRVNITILLCLFFVCYFIFAYLVFGPPEAHWYRYIWAFLLGHIVAIQNRISKWFAIIVLIPFVLLIFLENKFMILSYVIAICLLLFISKLEKRYMIKAGAPLLFLGSVSYFYYLSHVRIGWQVLAYVNVFSLFVWIALSLLIAFFLKLGYSKIISKINIKGRLS